MANIADCNVLIEPNWGKLGKVITMEREFDTEQDTAFESQKSSTKITVNYEEMLKVLKEHGIEATMPRINYTRSLRLIYNPNIKKVLLEWVFDAAWGFPAEVEDWLNAIEAPYQLGVVENGCEVEGVEGEEFGMELLYRIQCDDCGMEKFYHDKDERDKDAFRDGKDGKSHLTCPECESQTEVCLDTVLEYDFTPIEVAGT